uniref:Uncharacterized protein n=1 Tax=Anguilla anguilla TaxID=7936 RepID=A0A0E9TB34_ANGAN
MLFFIGQCPFASCFNQVHCVANGVFRFLILTASLSWGLPACSPVSVAWTCVEEGRVAHV